jgi:hypothetical protein
LDAHLPYRRPASHQPPTTTSSAPASSSFLRSPALSYYYCSLSRFDSNPISSRTPPNTPTPQRNPASDRRTSHHTARIPLHRPTEGTISASIPSDLLPTPYQPYWWWRIILVIGVRLVTVNKDRSTRCSYTHLAHITIVKSCIIDNNLALSEYKALLRNNQIWKSA